MRNLRIVVGCKCRLVTNREWMRIVGTTSLAKFLISLMNCTFASHVYPLTVYFIADAIFLSPQHSASRTQSLSVSTIVLLSFALFLFVIKIPGKPFQIIIDYNKLFWFTSLFHLEVCSQYNLSVCHCQYSIIFLGKAAAYQCRAT